jgi:hypothetical protein
MVLSELAIRNYKNYLTISTILKLTSIVFDVKVISNEKNVENGRI